MSTFIWHICDLFIICSCNCTEIYLSVMLSNAVCELTDDQLTWSLKSIRIRHDLFC